ncbi:MAG TPA: hypothetical protein VIM18_00980 [Solirubrobacteraceae bacterium]|jgi:predicted NAD/FAD-binding protein
MNRLQSLRAEREFCVTLNRTAEIAPEKVIRTISYAHPVFTTAGVSAQARVAEISGQNRTHFCGAYWGWGFHEDGVASAVRVGEKYLGYCEAGFAERRIAEVQILLAKPLRRAGIVPAATRASAPVFSGAATG